MDTRTMKAMAAVAAMLSFGTVRAAPLSDLWWSPLESGWGMQLVQQGEVAFATLFVYDAEGRPTWRVASDLEPIAFRGVDGLPILSGALYRTTGPRRDAPFDPQLVTRTRVGDITIEPLSSDQMRITYTDEGLAVSKVLERQTWRAEFLGGFFLAAFDLRFSTPSGMAIGGRRFTADLVVNPDNGRMSIRAEEAGSAACVYEGQPRVSGKLTHVSGTYRCGTDDAGTFEMRDIEATPHGLTGSLSRHSPSQEVTGHFSATR